VFQSQANNNTTFSIKAIILTASTSTLLDLTKTEVVQSQIVTNFILDNTISIPATAKVWIAVYSSNILAGETFTLNAFNLNFNLLKNYTIPIIEKSFNDTYNLVTNSNGRVSVVDENAKQTYFPTLIRFGGAYQVNTNINQINNFKFENFDEYDRSFGDVIRLHVRDRYLKVYQKFKVGNVPILTQIVKDSANNPLQANTDVLINKIQYYAGDYGIGDAATSLAWNNFADYFVDNYRGVVCRLSQDGITPISITNYMNAFFVAKLSAYRQELNNGVVETGVYMGNPCIYGVFDAYTNKYIIALEEIDRYYNCNYNGGTAIIIPTTTTTTTAAPTTTTTAAPTTTTTATPTTTTTQPQVWYNLYNCSTGVIETSASFPNGTFAIDQRVVYGGSLFFYVTQVLYTDPGGIQWSVSSAGGGLTFCPATTTSTTTIPPLAIVVTISCDNTQPGATYLGKASVAITGGSGLYQIKAGFVPTYSTLVAVTTDPFVITSPTANYDGILGLRDTTGGSDKFLVYVIDSFGTIDTSASDINCVAP
jgi:hypothetical protein